MVEFGKRKPANTTAAYSRPVENPVDLATAAEVVSTGKLPFWSNISSVSFAMMMVAAAGLLWWLVLPYGGDILRDYRLAHTWRPAYDLTATDGKCTRHQFILTTCNATLKSLAEPNAAPIDVSFMMAFAGGGGEAMVPVRSAANPSQVSIAYAAETQLFNRTLTFVAIVFGLLATVFIGLNALLKGQYKGGAADRALIAGLEELQARMHAAPPPRAAA